MAIAVIVGIIFATFLTLIVVPVLYSIVDDLTDLFRKHFVPDEGEAAAELAAADGRREEPSRGGRPGARKPTEAVPALRRDLEPDPQGAA